MKQGSKNDGSVNPDSASSPSWLFIAAPVYIGWRIYWANRLPITDCDEVYNYWEPLHFLLFGSGMQTWEYAHEFALRTYAYLVPLKFLGRVISPWVVSLAPLLADYGASASAKLAVFMTLRSCLGLACAVCELTFLHALADTVSGSTPWVAVLLLLSSGMNHSAAAFLPSSTWMMSWMLCTALYLKQQHLLFVLMAVTTTLTVGWPFGVVMLVPLGVHILWKAFVGGHLGRIILWTIACTVIVQSATMVVDQIYYGKWTSPTVNIFTYNAAGGGDELYGVEPVSYYIKNLALNLNFAAPLGMVALPVILLFDRRKYSKLVIVLTPLILWMAITFPRPHKEERFLFPIYPLLILGAVLVVDLVIDGINIMVAVSKTVRHLLHGCIWTTSAAVSIARTMALARYYAAPLPVYAALSSSPAGLVCTCGEWYRYPSSFFLPGELAFLPSTFHGQLPQPFVGSDLQSSLEMQPFNDQNLEQKERYADAASCDYVVDLDSSECAASLDQSLTPMQSFPFLNAGQTSTLHRTIYLPFLHEKAVGTGAVVYDNYVVWRVEK